MFVSMNTSETTMNTSDASTDFSGAKSSPGVALLPMEEFLSYQIAMALWKFYPPVILPLGAFGNVMTIIIMSRMTSKESTVNMFFIVIAIGDLMVLFSGMMMNRWLEVTFHTGYTSRWSLLYYFLRWWVASTSGPIVGWTLVCVTLQRALAVVWPHHVARICTRRRVSLLIGSVTALMLALYSHYLFCLRVDFLPPGSDVHGACLALSPRYAWFLGNVFSYVDLAVFSVLPFAALVLGNGVLLWRLVRSTKEAAAGQSLAAVTARHIQKRNQANSSVTLTVIVVSLTFIVLTFPCSLYLLLYHFQEQAPLTARDAADVYLFFTVSFLLADSNSAVNFYLYCLTGRRFREEFLKIVRCRSLQKYQRNPAESSG